MSKVSTNSKSDLYTHIGIIVCLSLLLFFGFFYIYLPWRTNHGEAIKVPELKGKSMAEIEDILDDADLDYEVTDCTYVANQKPLTILTQYPKSGSSVKSGRKIYLTVVSAVAPMTKIPEILGRSANSAQNALQSYGLEMGQLITKPDLAENSVLEIRANGQIVKPGMSIQKGTKIDLIVGDGLGNQFVEVPNLVGKPLDEVQVLLQGWNLGNTIIYEASSKPAGTVIRQNPAFSAGNKIRIGDVIDIWVAGEPGEVKAEDTGNL
jgi:eukaryotic-like serine/threonine-protein kinase